jgi:hypothetical protein
LCITIRIQVKGTLVDEEVCVVTEKKKCGDTIDEQNTVQQHLDFGCVHLELFEHVSIPEMIHGPKATRSLFANTAPDFDLLLWIVTKTAFQ